MTTLLPSQIPPSSLLASRELLLIWQNPRSRRFSRAGSLRISGDDRFEFSYEPSIRSDPEFFALDEFPSMDRPYESDKLPAFFANRIMSAERPSYSDYLGWLGLTAGSVDLPVEVMVRTGAGRATDTFHVVEKPNRNATRFVSRFFVSGASHQESSSELISELVDGDRLRLLPEPANGHNPDAHLVLVSHGAAIGWVPDWLCGEVADLAENGWSVDVFAEKVNSDAPPHIQVLCRIEATRTIEPTNRA